MRKLKTILMEIKNNYRLTQTQQEVLALIFSSPTPELAYNATMGVKNLHTARETLAGWGHIIVGDNTVQLSTTGKRQLKSYGIIADGELTEYGRKLMGETEEDTSEWG